MKIKKRKTQRKSHLKLNKKLEAINENDFALGIIKNIESNFGVDLFRIFADSKLTEREKLRKGQQALVSAALLRLNNLSGAEKFDLHFRNNGLAYLATADVEVEPNVSFDPASLSVIMGYQGESIKTYLFNMTERFEQIAEATRPEEVVGPMLAVGLIGIGVPMGLAAGSALAAGASLSAAVLAGVSSVGLGTVVGVAVVILVLLLFFLFFDNPKKLFGMVINLTSNNLVVQNWREGLDGYDGGNLYMDRGHMLNFMQDQSSLSAPYYQIKGAEFLDDIENRIVFAGLYFANKNVGFYGAKGVMVFTSPNSDLQVAHMFACPYSKDNGTNMALVNGPVNDIEDFYDSLYDSRNVAVFVEEGGYRLWSRVNDNRGGVVGCIASIAEAEIPL